MITIYSLSSLIDDIEFASGLRVWHIILYWRGGRVHRVVFAVSDPLHIASKVKTLCGASLLLVCLNALRDVLLLLSHEVLEVERRRVVSTIWHLLIGKSCVILLG